MIRTPVIIAAAIWASTFGGAGAPQAWAKDYVVVIGGGPTKEQNQASMEANVLFFLQLLEKRAAPDREVSIFFADGQDPGRDLQFLLATSDLASESGLANESAPSTDSGGPSQSQPDRWQPAQPGLRDLIADLSRRGPRGSRGLGGGPLERFGAHRKIAYRDHRVPGALPTDPRLIGDKFQSIASKAISGDRLFVYVTAHGSSDRDFEFQNTSIACWDGEIRVKDLAAWLAPLPESVPVYYVMAQCYTGGFANLIFKEPTAAPLQLTPQNHIGFMAQQYDLPAAGCRPDIEVDEEYSSYFWGAIVGHMRNGQPIGQADLDGDGVVSFSEAHAHAVAFSQTIDIPLRSSDRLLREYSDIPGYESLAERRRQESEAGASTEISDRNESLPRDSLQPNGLHHAAGPIGELIALADIENRHIVEILAADLKIPVDTDFEDLPGLRRSRAREIRDRILSSLPPRQPENPPGSQPAPSPKPASDGFSPVREESRLDEPRRDEMRRRGGPRNAGGRSGRRELLTAIEQKWPEISAAIESRNWAELEKLESEILLEEIRKLPEYERYQRLLAERSLGEKIQAETEMFHIKLRRLTETLELILLEKNLEQVAAPEVVAKFQEMKRLEREGAF